MKNRKKKKNTVSNVDNFLYCSQKFRFVVATGFLHLIFPGQ